MASNHTEEQLTRFVRDTFGSVWTLELLLLVRSSPHVCWSTGNLVKTLRASESVVNQGIQNLLAAGLIVTNEEGAIRYNPANSELEEFAEATEALYVQKPDAVRRFIVLTKSPGLDAFADAFRLRKD